MCTISWLYQSHSYHVFFNRDEQITRERALAPRLFSAPGFSRLMPIDPEGEGSWVAVNTAGITLALLNFYQGRLPKGRLTSRGSVIRELSALGTLEDINRAVKTLSLAKYAPFSLLIFLPTFDGAQQSVVLWQWDGRALQKKSVASPIISSARFFEEVLLSRLSDYRTLVGKPKDCTVDSFYRLHQHHGECPSARSICMHREDARTVSFSHIEVSATNVVFRYKDGAACGTAPIETFKLAR
ncbi:NRDE family protein [Teredinibacter purpureus]|uniref:NRDE family protein n=1 Tax=Teredinibacter purpureus TaxID=2731756 RepID=UPI0005F7A08B|nr:NRDE family protein [Teredinibacter purpureus]